MRTTSSKTSYLPWLILGTVAVSMTLIYGIRHSFAVFFPSILDQYGWGRGSTALMLSLNLLLYGLLAPVAGGLGDRWKPRTVMLSGVVLVALATIGCAFASQLWHFYVLFGVFMPIGTALCGYPLIGPMLSHWFRKRRGMILGIGQVGGGLSFTYGLFAEAMIERVGWQYAYIVLAAVLLVIVVPLYLAFIYYRPEDKGLQAYGMTGPAAVAKPETGPAGAGNAVLFREWTLGAAMKTRQLWLIIFSYFLYWGLSGYLVSSHQVKFAEDIGFSSTLSASISALFGVAIVAGLFSASLSDWLGREKTLTISSILAAGAVLSLLTTTSPSQQWHLYVYAICLGYGVGLFWPTAQAGLADIFYCKRFGAIMGLLQIGVGLGGLIGPWLGGYLHDITGSYRPAFILCLVCFSLSCVTFWIAASRNAVIKSNLKRQKSKP